MEAPVSSITPPAAQQPPPPPVPEAGTVPEIPDPKHRPRGKIARLSPPVRERLNLLLDEGITYAQVIDRLGFDAENITEMDISRWYHSGFQDWTRNQLWLEQTRSRLDMAIDVIAEHEGANVHQANLHIAATQLIHDLMARGETILEQDPEQYVNVVNSVTRLSREALGFQKYREACMLARAELAKLKDPDHKPSEEEILVIVDKLDRILGFK